MKIPFTLDAWLKDKSRRVETRDGRLVHNIWRVKEPSYTTNRKAEVCVLIDGEEEVLVFFEGGRYLPTTQDTDSPFDLFLITPEPELTEFEEHLKQLLDFSVTLSSPYEIDCIKTEAAELLELARKELEPEVLERLDAAYKNQDEVVYENGKRDGKAEAEKDLALTAEDVKSLVTIADSMLTHTAWDAIDWLDEQKYYEEVLRRFNEQRP